MMVFFRFGKCCFWSVIVLFYDCYFISIVSKGGKVDMVKKINLNNLTKGYDANISFLNEYFFYCLQNSLRSRGITFDISLLYDKSKFLTKVDAKSIPLVENSYLKSFKFFEDGNILRLDVNNTVDLLPKNVNANLLSSFRVDEVLCNFLGEYASRLILKEENRKLIVRLGGLYSSSSSTHLHFFDTVNTISWLRECVSLEKEDQSNIKIDLELEVVLRKALYIKTLKQYTINERLKYFKEHYPIGSIGVLFERYIGKNLANKDRVPIGFITMQKIVEITGYTDDGFTYNSFNCFRTKMEVRRQFNQIAEDKQDGFLDMLNPKVSVQSGSQSLFSTSVDWLIAPFDTSMLSLIDSNEVVEKEFLVKDKPVTLKLSGPVAIYLLLKEYDVKFNEEMFKEMYNISGIDGVF